MASARVWAARLRLLLILPGVILAAGLLERFVLEPRYADGSASLVLSGVVREVSVRHSAVSTVGLALEDQLELVVDVSIRRRADGSVVWRREGWTQLERYTSSADLAIVKVAVENPGLVSYNLFSVGLTARF